MPFIVWGFEKESIFIGHLHKFNPKKMDLTEVAIHFKTFISAMVFLGMALSLVRGFVQLSALAPRLAPTLILSDLLEIETALPEIKAALLEIEATVPALPEIEILSYKVPREHQMKDHLVTIY